MAVETRYNDPATGAAIIRKDYSPTPRPSVSKQHDYHPIEPDEALKWAVGLGALCLVGAALTNVVALAVKLAYKDNGLVQGSVFANVAFPSPWLLAIAIPTYIVFDAYRMRRRYEAIMIDSLSGDEVWGEEAEDMPTTAPTAQDILYAQCVAVLRYAFANGGPAPVPRTTRNGTASLPLGSFVGGTLDGNDYPAVAAVLRDRYQLMEGGDSKPWRLTKEWDSEDELLDAFDAAFNRHALR